jgi:hypothetical protein
LGPSFKKIKIFGKSGPIKGEKKIQLHLFLKKSLLFNLKAKTVKKAGRSVESFFDQIKNQVPNHKNILRTNISEFKSN